MAKNGFGNFPAAYIFVHTLCNGKRNNFSCFKINSLAKIRYCKQVEEKFSCKTESIIMSRSRLTYLSFKGPFVDTFVHSLVEDASFF